MTICFTPTGFSRFAHSLSRFCGMSRPEALTFANQCAHANFDAFRVALPEERMGEIKGLSLWDEAKPYQTEVQLFKAIQALLGNIGGETDSEQESAAHLRALLNDLNEHCWNSYGLDIEDERTVYALCESTLEPNTEPPVCLVEDWNAVRMNDV